MLRCINFSGWESLQTSQDLPQSLQEATCCQKLEEWWKSSRFPSSQQTPWELERCWRALGIQNWGAEGLSLHTSPHCKPRVGSCWKTSQHRALALQTNLGGWGAFISSNQLFPWLQMENRESSTRWGRDKKGQKGAKSSPLSRRGRGDMGVGEEMGPEHPGGFFALFLIFSTCGMSPAGLEHFVSPQESASSWV